MAVPLGVGDVLAEAGDLTARRLSRASTWQKTYGGTIERALLSTGAVPVGELISARRPLAEHADVFRDLSYGDAMKTCLIP